MTSSAVRLTLLLAVLGLWWLWLFEDQRWAAIPWLVVLGLLGIANVRHARENPGPSALARWWDRVPGPSKDPGDYR